jgi:hypothetical protein
VFFVQKEQNLMFVHLQIPFFFAEGITKQHPAGPASRGKGQRKEAP